MITTMSLKVTKEEKASGATGSVASMSKVDKLETIMTLYKTVKNTTPNYEALEDELNTYDVELPEEVDIPDISKINKLYAIAQSFLTRSSTIERISINNQTSWQRLVKFMEGYIQDREAELLISDELKTLKTKMQDAELRNRLSKDYERLGVLNDKLLQANGFVRVVQNKVSDLKSVLTNLNRQARTLENDRKGV